MYTRRSLIQTFTLCVLGTCGCLSQPNSDTGSNTETDKIATGGRPPWATKDSNADIIISNNRDDSVVVSLSVGEDDQEIEIGADDDWVSGNILETKEEVSIAVESEDGLKKSFTWPGEQNGGGYYVVFNIDEERMRVRGFEKEE